MSPDLYRRDALATLGAAIRPVLSAGELRGLRDAVSAHIDRVSRSLLAPYASTFPDASLEERLERLAQRDRGLAETLWHAACADAQRDPRIAALPGLPALREAVSEVAGITVGEATIRVRANIPALPHRRQQWHSDVARDDGTACAQIRVTCWLPLIDVDETNGSLEICAGRRSAPIPHARPDRRFVIPDEDLEGQRLSVRCPAGHGVFLDRFTPHRALPNQSGRARWSVVLWLKAA